MIIFWWLLDVRRNNQILILLQMMMLKAESPLDPFLLGRMTWEPSHADPSGDELDEDLQGYP